jgi:hypothetical protein
MFVKLSMPFTSLICMWFAMDRMRLMVRKCCSQSRVLPNGRPQQAQSVITRSWCNNLFNIWMFCWLADTAKQTQQSLLSPAQVVIVIIPFPLTQWIRSVRGLCIIHFLSHNTQVYELHSAITCRSVAVLTVFNIYFHHKKAFQFKGSSGGVEEEITFLSNTFTV